jgi:N-glycosidase YbiA
VDVVWASELSLDSMISIHFYAVDKPYGCFSNFARYPIIIDGLTWATSEHYFQASKMTEAHDRDEIRNAKTPFLAAQLGRQRSRSIRADWDAVKEVEMLRALRIKFEQNINLKEILVSTAGAHLIEHTANDSYWGDAGDGSGLNRLGGLLEQVRAESDSRLGVFHVPPWVKYSDVEVSDLFWRMGQGEEYSTQSGTWKQRLSPAALAEYEAYFPVPAEWRHSW